MQFLRRRRTVDVDHEAEEVEGGKETCGVIVLVVVVVSEWTWTWLLT